MDLCRALVFLLVSGCSTGIADVGSSGSDGRPDNATSSANATSSTDEPGDQTDTGPTIESSSDGSTSESAADSSSDTGSDAPTETELIDDLEDGNALIIATQGRIGAWFTSNDQTPDAIQLPEGPFAPSPGGLTGSQYHAYTTGSGFTTWGASIGFDFHRPDGQSREHYDASGYRGITFAARGRGAMRFRFQTAATTETSNGGTCNQVCEDSYGAEIELNDRWINYSFSFDELSQQGWGTVVPFDPTESLGLRFLGPIDEQFEIALDDIAFFY